MPEAVAREKKKMPKHLILHIQMISYIIRHCSLVFVYVIGYAYQNSIKSIWCWWFVYSIS
jgi:hypothetical protein